MRFIILPIVSKYDALAKVIAQIKQQQGAITGVLHCAGIHRDGYLLTKSLATFDAVLAAKVMGLENIDKALAKEPD